MTQIDWPTVGPELLKALEPFADAAAWWKRQYPKTPRHQAFALVLVPVEEGHFTMADMARARRAIATAKGEDRT